MKGRTIKKPEERRQEFVEAAKSLFLEKGYQNASVSDIVGQMGVAHGLFYYYFSSKENLLDAIIDNLVQESKNRLSTLVGKDGTPLEKFYQFVQQMFILKKDKPYLIGYMLQDRNRLFYHKWMQHAFREIAPLLTDIVKQGVAEGCFDTKHPREAVEFTLNGMRFFLSSNEELQGESLQRKIIAAGDMMERVLGAQSESIISMYLEIMPDVLNMMEESMKFAAGCNDANRK